MEGMLSELIVQVIAGAVGGTAAGSWLKDLSLGKAGDAISGAVGGGLVGQILATLTTSDAVAGLDIESLIRDVVGGGVGGAVVMAIVGAIRNAIAK